ncbi:MAG: YceI family protein [Candidatus Dormibacteria bacterium]
MADSITLGPSDGSLRLHTTRTGAAAKMGHDLVIEVQRWSAQVTATEDGTALASLTATAESASCAVVEGGGGVKPLSDKDKVDIKKNIDEKVLQVDRYPQITFVSTSVEGSTISGQLSLAGTTRPWQLTVEAEGNRVRGTGSIVQTDFGIKPFAALMGTLKVGDVVGVSIDVSNPRA